MEENQNCMNCAEERVKKEVSEILNQYTEEKDNLISSLDKIDSLSCEGRVYEKTIQYNSTLEGNDFYSESIDGRYRVRLTKGKNFSKCLLSWKRRLNDINKSFN